MMEKQYQEPRRKPKLRVTGPPVEEGEELQRVEAIGKAIGVAALIGRLVTNAEGEPLGHIKDIMINAADSRATLLLLNPEAALGMVNRVVVVPWQGLHLEHSLRRLVLHLSPEQLRNAPAFDVKHVPDMTDPEWVRNTYRYYGYEADWVI